MFHCHFINIVLFHRREILSVYNVCSFWQHLIKCNFLTKMLKKAPQLARLTFLTQLDQGLIKPQRVSVRKTNRSEVILRLNAPIKLARRYFYWRISLDQSVIYWLSERKHLLNRDNTVNHKATQGISTISWSALFQYFGTFHYHKV